jgi:hypothetical protein
MPAHHLIDLLAGQVSKGVAARVEPARSGDGAPADIRQS